jgi:hypothetical protein
MRLRVWCVHLLRGNNGIIGSMYVCAWYSAGWHGSDDATGSGCGHFPASGAGWGCAVLERNVVGHGTGQQCGHGGSAADEYRSDDVGER